MQWSYTDTAFHFPEQHRRGRRGLFQQSLEFFFLFFIYNRMCRNQNIFVASDQLPTLPSHIGIVTDTGWKKKYIPNYKSNQQLKDQLGFVYWFFFKYGGQWILYSGQFSWFKHLSPFHLVFNWFGQNVTPVKILYKAYPSSHNTAKCKKGPATPRYKGFFTLPLSLSPFFH